MSDQNSLSPLGFVNFDDIRGQNNEIELRIPFDEIKRIQRGQYVLIGSVSGEQPYLGRVISGPFYTPDAVSKDSAFARTSILLANEVPFLPDFHGVCRVELLGRVSLDDYHLSGFASRPFPKTPVLPMPPDQIAQLLGLEGNMYLGHLTGYEQIRVCFNAHVKKVLPRNVGVFGTVGSGKTNTAQVLIEEAIASGWAVVVLDVEGEYISMNKPNGEAQKKPLAAAMKKFGVSPRGIENVQVFHCPGTESRCSDAREFCLRFGNLSPYDLIEIMGMSEAQEIRFLELYEKATTKLKTKQDTTQHKHSKWDRLAGNNNPVGLDSLPNLTLQFLMDQLDIENQDSGYGNKASWNKVLQLLINLKRYQIFDSVDYVFNADDLLKPGQLSVYDLSDANNVRVNNIIIAQILREIFQKKVDELNAPPTLVVIEEAHTFVSRENVKAMESIVDMLRAISRRGRKRWLGLCFISQQPAHLPNEIFELCNTKVIHQTTGKRNLDALQISAGNVNEAVWGEIPLLGQGQALIISPQFAHPVLCDMRPCSTHREYTD